MTWVLSAKRDNEIIWMPNWARVRGMSWQVERKRTGRTCVGAGVCYLIIWWRVSTQACCIYFPVAMPLSTAHHQEGAQGDLKDGSVAIHQLEKSFKALGCWFPSLGTRPQNWSFLASVTLCSTLDFWGLYYPRLWDKEQRAGWPPHLARQ